MVSATQLSTLSTNYKVCNRCIYDERVPSISFDSDGICNYCHQIDRLVEEYGTGQEKGKKKFEDTVEDIKRSGYGKKYDCVIGVSGGTDSSYMLYLARAYGLRPLAVHYDNTWNGSTATLNINRVLKALDIDLYTWVVNNKEVDDIFRSFMLAGVPEIEASTDLALAEVMYRAAHSHGIKYILEGHSFVTEGISPLGKNYFDGQYIRSIHRRFGKLPMKTYPLMTFSRFVYWSSFARIKKIRPFWYLDYSKEHARSFLEREYGWEYYGGHHLENRMTAFFHSIYAPNKFDMDFRNNTLGALVRNGMMNRSDAWRTYNEAPMIEEELAHYVRKRLAFSEAEYNAIMDAPPKSWHDYPTYKKRFERLRPLFYILAKTELVPMSFYLKYCFPTPENTKV